LSDNDGYPLGKRGGRCGAGDGGGGYGAKNVVQGMWGRVTGGGCGAGEVGWGTWGGRYSEGIVV